MKFASTLALVGSVSAKNVTLRDVFGEPSPVSYMLPHWQRRMPRTSPSQSFLSKRTPDNCIFPIDLVIVQDATASFEDDFDNMANTQLGLMETALAATHPGSKVGVVSFRDKPIWSLGEPRTDYCQKLELPLTEDFEQVTTLYKNLVSNGGGDPPENQFGALLATSSFSQMGWGGNADASKLVVVVTDAAPHFEGDGFNLYGLSTFPGNFNEEQAENDCVTYYYPTPEQTKSALLRQELYLGALVYDSQYDNFQPRDSWTWFNQFIGQLPEFYHDMNENSSNFWEVLSAVITALEDVECHETTTTAPVGPTVTPVGTEQVAPSTTPPVDQASSTTPSVGETLPPSCEVCPNPCPPEGCDPCCLDGVLIKLRHRPARLHLEIENPPSDL